MKYDDLEIQESEAYEKPPVQKNVKKKKKVSILDVVIVQSMLCVLISVAVLTARVISVLGSDSKPPIESARMIDTVDNYDGIKVL